ncbi:MAG: hypothetical protein PUD20_10260 [bacterium]|nr:hypothetical protein [bacterium]
MDSDMNLEINKQRQQKIKTPQQLMREHLTTLQSWDLAENQTVEQRRADHMNRLLIQQKEINELIKDKANVRLGAVQAKQAAEGTPLQRQKPAKKTFMQKAEEKRLDWKAKQKTSVADHVSVRMYESMMDNQTMLDNALKLIPNELAERNTIDYRVLGIYVHGFRTDKNGDPISEQDSKNKQSDEQFLNDYCTANLEDRRPHLNRIVEQLLTMNLTENMLTETYLCDHLAEVKNKVNQLTFFQNVYNDPVNRPYFEALDPLTRDLIEHRVLSRYELFGSVLGSACAMKGIDSEHLVYMTNIRSKSDLNVYSKMLTNGRMMLHEELARSEAEEKVSVEREVKRQKELAKEKLMEGARTMKEQAETMGDISGLGFTGYVTEDSFDELSKYRAMIEAHPSEYAQNSRMIDTLYQSLYRVIDALGDVTLESMAAQSVRDIAVSKPERMTVAERLLEQAFADEVESLGRDTELIREQLNAYADAFQSLLLGTKLSAGARELLHRMGHI